MHCSKLDGCFQWRTASESGRVATALLREQTERLVQLRKCTLSLLRRRRARYASRSRGLRAASLERRYRTRSSIVILLILLILILNPIYCTSTLGTRDLPSGSTEYSCTCTAVFGGAGIVTSSGSHDPRCAPGAAATNPHASTRERHTLIP
eukprot:COSAG02_NODE_400_length_23094_cov_309.555990_16_plen_151_part_00